MPIFPLCTISFCRRFTNDARFTLANHLVDLDRDVKAPEYVEENSYMDLTSLQYPDQENDDPKMTDNDTPNLWNVDVLRNFPKNLSTSMDDSQMAACRSMLTKRVSIVQGPPGTGKTFTSVSALRVLIESLGPDDPPIIVAAQTNHALDQLLNHIMKFEKGIARLGGRADKDNTEILKRTLFELRQSNQITDGKASLGHCRKEHEACIAEMRDIMGPILGDKLIDADTLLKYGLITDKQHGSLNEEDWSDGSDPDGGIFVCKFIKHQFTSSPVR
jgi:helicase required for RNAi-mediated heterochromatin assembly 1